MRVLLPILLLALATGGCGPEASPYTPLAKKSIAPHSQRAPKPMKVSATVDATFIGGHTPAQTFNLLGVAMATNSVGWAWANSGPAAEATYGMATADGGPNFHKAFGAPLRIVAASAPDPNHAYFLESACLAGCTSQIQIIANDSTAPRTIWKLDGVASGSLSFPTSQDGYVEAVQSAEGNPGKAEILVTHDGGATFSDEPSPCSGEPYASAIDFTDPQQGWLLCGSVSSSQGKQQKTLFETTNGGQSWVSVASSVVGTLPADGSIHTLSFMSPTVGFIGLDGYGVLQTLDGGRHWSQVFASQTRGDSFPVAVGFLKGGYGWLLRNAQQPFEITTDGGQTWQVGDKQPGEVQWVTDLGGGRAVAYTESAGSPPQLLETADDGASWSTDASLSFHATALQAMSLQDIAAGGGTGVEISEDGGKTWSAQALSRSR